MFLNKGWIGNFGSTGSFWFWLYSLNVPILILNVLFVALEHSKENIFGRDALKLMWARRIIPNIFDVTKEKFGYILGNLIPLKLLPYVFAILL